MRKRAASFLAPFLNPEMPLFGVGFIAAAVICVLAGIVLWSTFLEGMPAFGAKFSLSNYTKVLLDPVTRLAARNTLMVAIGTVLVSCFFAVPMAWLIHRTNVAGKRFFLTLMFAQILLPGFLRVMGWIMLLSPGIGIVNQFLRIFIPVESGPLSIYNIPSIAFVQGLALTPTLFFMVAGAFTAIDPSLEESAEVAGASRLQNVRRIALPLILPALVGGVLYIFMTAVSMFEVAALLGMPSNIHVFSTLMFFEIFPEVGFPQYGIAGVYGVILLVPTMIALFYYQKMLRVSHRYATVTGKGYRPKLTDLGRWQLAGVGFIVFFFLFDLVLPFLSILWTSVVPRIQLPTVEAFSTIRLDGYVSAFLMLGEGEVLANTAQLVLSVGVLSVVIGLVFSWIVLRTRLPGRYVIDTISMLPHAVPGVAFAFSVAFVGLLLVKTAPLFYGSLAAIILADTIRRIPYTSRTISGSLIQIHRDLEDAVQTSGGSRIVAIRRVLVPLITPALAYSFMWAALQAYREVTIALFLQSPRSLVMSTAIWQRWQGGDSATAAALGIIMLFSMGIIIFTLLRAFPQIFGERRP